MPFPFCAGLAFLCYGRIAFFLAVIKDKKLNYAYNDKLAKIISICTIR